ncbi:Predicted N-acyltransferase, GNAT family [Halobacillus alkaliphilus]|uniref:Predicted N-acyltransferase, GNAT family n=1 Tax=Halobacillus alkaliphilus TaxID=396056 RepID=A0A1I2RF21_9BACI|nr:GNAT family N-acetyltransferase [Halobacillus alkaliphilus]SFG39082.1 Predicted N-acyltransferase, GNAT family [Halobacillus alkaliphilus]
MEVLRIEAAQTYTLRHNVLRPHQPFEACQYDTDHDDDTFHIGAFNEGKLVSVASFYLESHSEFTSSKQYRLRAMATAEDFRNKGAGREVIHYAERIVKERKANMLWCKGRTSVRNYYQKLGFRSYGDVFNYPGLGPHVIMYKTLS